MIEQLNQEWKDLREGLNKDRIKFDEEYRKQHTYHNCDTKVYAYNGNWFCEHMTKARNKKFMTEIQKAEKIINVLSEQLISEKFI